VKVKDCVGIADLQRLAKRRLPVPVYTYLVTGSEDEVTAHANFDSYRRWSLLPQVLVDVERVDLKTTVLGCDTKMPILLAPTGFNRLFHHDGELAVARAADAAGLWSSLSTYGSETIESFAEATSAPKLFQLYCQRDRDLQANIVEQASQANYDALCVTVDTAMLGNREGVVRSGLMRPPLPPVPTIARLMTRPLWLARFLANRSPELAVFGERRSAVHKYSPDPSFDWDDLAQLRKEWPRRLVLKGMFSTDDARRAADAGVDAVVISNHAGRQLDRVPATLDMLPEIVSAVGDDIEVLVDGGIRRGTDVVTALCLGAKAVLVGSAPLFGLAAGGEAGVQRALKILKDELRRDLTLLGAQSVSDLDPSFLRPASRSELTT
jgi:L-lactate dehydrogenase (cytochrome)